MNFVIVSLPRTGTTMLCIALNNLDGFNVYGEILTNKMNHMIIKTHPQKSIEDFRQKNRPKNLYNFLSKKYNFTGTEYPLKNITKKDIYEYLDGIYEEDGIVGFKLLHPHIKRLPQVVNYINDRKIKVVHLYREDREKQIISAYTNQFMHKHDGKKKMELGENQIKQIDQKIINNKNKDKEIESLFSNSIKLSYEDMTNDVNAEIINTKNISNFLNIPDKIKSYTKKYGPSEIKDRVKNLKK